MRMNRCFPPTALVLLAALALPRLAGAQTYIWTDERGVAHAAADPSEVPPQYREKAVHDAAVQRPSVRVVPDDNPAPVARMPSPASHAPDNGTQPPAANAPGSADPTPRAPNRDDPDPRTRALGKPDPGFEWHCLTDPEGGPPKCTQEEKKYNKRARRADAREKAEKELGVQPGDEADPDVQRKVDQKAEEEFKKTTPTPTTKAPKHTSDDEGDPEDQD